MTKFDRAQFTTGEYLMYGTRFVARFKHARRDRAGFISFLIKNFTVEEYFAAYDAGMTPTAILETKGYVSTTVKIILRDSGFEQTQEGFRAYIAARMNARAA